ncbi:hypothetical protein CLM62_25800 [Streptomyces sp. SA15]|nr:hypothetical protein CLM62_25800 [Streptomyces sp. SA15]
MSRSVMRYVPHTIRHAPDLECTREAFCTAADCKETSGPGDEDAVQMWCLRHAGRTGHGTFRRVFTDHARVERTE